MSLQDKRSILQVIGSLMQKPSLLDETKLPLEKNDFPEPFHKIIFACINNLYTEGLNVIDYIAIDNFLSQYPKQYKIFMDNNGMDYLIEAVENASVANFNYNYERIKKFSLLREYQIQGVDISEVYDEKIISPKKQEEMQERFDSLSLQDITIIVDKKILSIKEKFLSEHGNYGQHAGENLKALKEELKKEPEIGSPLCGGIYNTIFRGARLKKLYLRSAPTGVGKTRLSLGDATNLAVDEIYCTEKKAWVTNGVSEPVLFITTELEMDEVQTPMIAFVSGVNEDKILDGNYTPEEEARVDKAIEIISRSKFYIEYLPNFDIAEVERTIQRYVLNFGIKYVMFDYIHISLDLLTELANQSKGMRLREDNVLLMFITRLKDLCNSLGVFLMTSTQLNGDFKHTKDADQTLLRGSKAMADKADVGVIVLEPTTADLEALKPILNTQFIQEPNLVSHVYKNRRGKWNRVKVWSYADLGTCRIKDLFMTDNDYKLIPIESTEIETYLSDEIDKETGEIIQNTVFDF